eukprot:m.188335 g.188335  ORF g.188335 m.188335 type:complete len:77 (+) comp18526_c0_seq2:2382-2612(+)
MNSSLSIVNEAACDDAAAAHTIAALNAHTAAREGFMLSVCGVRKVTNDDSTHTIYVHFPNDRDLTALQLPAMLALP